MKAAIQSQLTAIQNLVHELSISEYTLKQDILSGSSIGQHVRHILEFYTCLLEGIEKGKLSYDNRKRDIRIETDRLFTCQLIQSIMSAISRYDDDQPLQLNANFSTESDKVNQIRTSFYRELAYVLEHGIHHQALIKIGVKNLCHEEFLDEGFGIAFATIRHQKIYRATK